MAAPRATQFIALRNLARGSQQVRQLSMTGPKTFASTVLERPVLSLPRDLAGLRAECQRRSIDTAGPKRDLIDRLNAHELTRSRALSTAINKTERPSAPQEAHPTPAVRHFNTSRERKAVNDTSTIDFAFLPDVIIGPENVDISTPLRVPIIPTGVSAPAPQIPAQHEDVVVVVMKPEINTMSADAVYLPMSESSDGHAMNIDFHAMAEKVALNLRRIKGPVEEQAGLAKQIFGDMVDDLMGLTKERKKTSSVA